MASPITLAGIIGSLFGSDKKKKAKSNQSPPPPPPPPYRRTQGQNQQRYNQPIQAGMVPQFWQRQQQQQQPRPELAMVSACREFKTGLAMQLRPLAGRDGTVTLQALKAARLNNAEQYFPPGVTRMNVDDLINYTSTHLDPYSGGYQSDICVDPERHGM